MAFLLYWLMEDFHAGQSQDITQLVVGRYDDEREKLKHFCEATNLPVQIRPL